MELRMPPLPATASKSAQASLFDFACDATQASASIRLFDREHRVRFTVSGSPFGDPADGFLAAALFPAMRAGAELHVDQEVSPRLLSGIRQIQDIVHVWDRRFRLVELRAKVREPARRAAAGTAAFFSGGVDSFYSLVKHENEIDALIYVEGFDIRLEEERAGVVREAIRRAAREAGKRLIEVTTDVRKFGDPYVNWEIYHGAALAAVALLLSPQFSRIYIPASHSFLDLFPWGSHPLLDPLWSTETLEVVHDGAEALRPEKVARIASSEAAMRWLRVCWRRPGGAYNCGRCEKCVRTMAALRLCGALGRCTTLPATLDVRTVARLRIPDAPAAAFWSELLRYTGDQGMDPPLQNAIRAALRNFALRQGARRAAKRVLGRTRS